MGTKGSHSCVYYGTNVNVSLHGVNNLHYFDIVNIDWYDAVLGALWLNTHGAILDFWTHIVHVTNGDIKTFDVLTECSFCSVGSQVHFGNKLHRKKAASAMGTKVWCQQVEMPTTSPPSRLTQKKVPNVKLLNMNNKTKKNYPKVMTSSSYPTAWPDPKSKWPQLPDCSNLEGLLMTNEKLEQLRSRINLINPILRHAKQHATCPQALEDQLREKMNCYKWAQWWVHRLVPTTCPLLCIMKKDGSLWTIIDTCHWNANMVLDIVSGRTVSWWLKLLSYPLCLQGSDTEEKGVPVKCN